MPEALRNESPWYEEDCEAAKVIVGFPELFSEQQYKSAVENVKNIFPETYENFFDTVIPEGESYKKDQELHMERHKNDYMVVTAFGINEEIVLVKANVGGDTSPFMEKKEKDFIVPRAEYRQRKTSCPFVIDRNRHKEVAIGHDTISLFDNDIKAAWINLKEGRDGDFNPDDPDDINFLRFQLFKWDEKANDYIEAPNSSYCSRVPVAISREKAIGLLDTIMETTKNELMWAGHAQETCEKLAQMEPSELEQQRPVNDAEDGEDSGMRM